MMYTSSQNTIIAVSTILPVLSCILIGLRLIARKQKSTPLGVDDWLVIISAVRISAELSE